jgi:hypothetical protein
MNKNMARNQRANQFELAKPIQLLSDLVNKLKEKKDK